MKIKLISDSTCDLSKELIEKYDIAIVPLYVMIDDQMRKDGVDMTPEDIYDYVERKGVLPSTSAGSIGDYIDTFTYWKEQGYDQIVHFSISSGFSSSYANACIAAEEVGDVFVVDSKNLSTGQGLVVLYGADLLAEGKDGKEIAESCSAITDKVEASFVVDSIDYLHKGGRCSAVAALGANLLSLKPCIEVEDGKMKSGKKYRGKISMVIKNYVKERLADRNDIDSHRIFITHTKCDEQDVQNVRDIIQEVAPYFEEILETTAGGTITTHCGPNTLGVLFVRK